MSWMILMSGNGIGDEKEKTQEAIDNRKGMYRLVEITQEVEV